MWPTLTNANTQILSLTDMQLASTFYVSGQNYSVQVRMNMFIYNNGSTIPSYLSIQTNHYGPANSPNTVNILPAYRFTNNITSSSNYITLANSQIHLPTDTSYVFYHPTIAVSTLQDFPDVFKPIYPASWTTP